MQAQNQTVILSGSCFPQAQFAAENSVSASLITCFVLVHQYMQKIKLYFSITWQTGFWKYLFELHSCILYLLYMQVMTKTNLKWLFSQQFLRQKLFLHWICVAQYMKPALSDIAALLLRGNETKCVFEWVRVTSIVTSRF